MLTRASGPAARGCGQGREDGVQVVDAGRTRCRCDDSSRVGVRFGSLSWHASLTTAPLLNTLSLGTSGPLSSIPMWSRLQSAGST
eukprot:364341-Chlamydomonas_euryale.AAC.1